MPRAPRRARAALDRLLRGALGRLHGSAAVVIPEYPLAPAAKWGWSGPPLTPVAECLMDGLSSYEAAVQGCLELSGWARTIPKLQRDPGEPCWENDWWGTVDALMQCASLKARDPARYIEIGSGFSTLFARRAIRDFGLRTTIVSVDPRPRAEVEGICDEAIRTPLEAVDLALFDRLTAGDILLIDGSHRALMSSDATILLLEVLPRLPAGVLVAIDDVFLPWDYPPAWADRVYGEQYLLAAFLLGGADGFRVRFPGWWLVESSPLKSSFEVLWPIVENRFGRHASSFWMERTDE